LKPLAVLRAVGSVVSAFQRNVYHFQYQAHHEMFLFDCFNFKLNFLA